MNDQFYDRRLFLKFVILASLLLWQLGHEFKFQTVAENRTVTQPLLPDGEVAALESVAYSLGYKGQDTFPNTLCNDTSSLKYLGISCNCSFNHNTTCHIDEISWRSKELYGNLPEDMVNLTHLARLDLSANQIIGSIPAILGKMNQQLYYLDLSANQIEGSIPAFLGNMSQLYYLDLSNNHLNGTLPSSLGNLLKAEFVVLDNNLLTGEIPSSLGNLSKLRYLINQLNGSLPRELGNLALLEYLFLDNNLLTGEIPSSLGNLSKLRYLNLNENQLNGSLPRKLGNLASLRYLSLQSNDFSGPLPAGSFARLNLWPFSISGNSLSGPFPDYIKNWNDVIILSLYGNNFQGKIPPEIFNLSSLDTLEISDVETSSFEFPSSTNLTEITTLVLRNCSITGPIPPYIGNLASLEFLDLSFNNLSGEIPSSLENINATYISFAENRLNGTISAWISRTAAWTKIDLSYNEFSNADNVSQHSNLTLFSCCPLCPASSCTTEMQGVDRLNSDCSSDGNPKYNSLYINCGGEETEIAGNRYDQDNSTLPSGVGPGRNWAFSSSGSFLTKSSNSSDYIRNAKCRIPVADAILYSKARLAPVSLKYYGLCLLNGNYSVTLHFAEVVYTGDDSQQHSDLKKRIFDVYIQKNLVRRDFHINNSGNTEQEKVDRIEYHKAEVKNGTLEIHLYWAGKGSSGNPPDYNGPLLSAISVTPDIKIGPKVSRSAVAMITLSSITVALVLSLAFAWKMGWLEKEEVHDIKVGDDKTVTLKQLIVATCGFNKDVEIGKGGFGTVYRLFDIHVGKDLCFLVYEYMENRSLADTLFDPDHKVKLNWEARYNICVGIAKGLQYLHEHPRLKMVHWGIKAANILLDAELKPKISDLGLASASVENDDEASHSLWIIKTEASTGYMAPEFPAIGKKSGYKYDVYSFGVLMLEIVCGTKNVGAGHKNKQDLVLLVDEVCVADSNGKLPNLVDESLSAYDTKQAMTILKLAMKCTHISPGVRPTMSQVVSVLADGKPLDEISTPAPKENDEKTEEDSLKELAKDADRSSVSE